VLLWAPFCPLRSPVCAVDFVDGRFPVLLDGCEGRLGVSGGLSSLLLKDDVAEAQVAISDFLFRGRN
jgi:hypothetical protein